MEKETARKIISESLATGDHLNVITHLVEQIEDQALAKTMRHALGEIMGKLYSDIMMPIISAHPDLDPDKANYP